MITENYVNKIKMFHVKHFSETIEITRKKLKIIKKKLEKMDGKKMFYKPKVLRPRKEKL